MSTYVVMIATALSIVWLPWPVTLVGMLVSSILFPPAGVLFGFVVDALYATTGDPSIPLGLAWGIGISALGYLLSYGIKSRLLGA